MTIRVLTVGSDEANTHTGADSAFATESEPYELVVQTETGTTVCRYNYDTVVWYK